MRRRLYGSLRAKGLFYLDHQQHLGMDVTMDFEPAGSGECHLDGLARRLLGGFEIQSFGIDKNLVKERILVGEQNFVTARDGNLLNLELPVSLRDPVRFAGHYDGTELSRENERARDDKSSHKAAWRNVSEAIRLCERRPGVVNSRSTGTAERSVFCVASSIACGL
jgi:hypothetical protein